jgi:hypothetical protein
MGMQLVLIDENEPEWRLDDRTVEIGRRGVAAARAVLASAPHHDRDVIDLRNHHSASRHAA